MATAQVVCVQQSLSQGDESTTTSSFSALYGLYRKFCTYVAGPKESMAAECMLDPSMPKQPNKELTPQLHHCLKHHACLPAQNPATLNCLEGHPHNWSVSACSGNSASSHDGAIECDATVGSPSEDFTVEPPISVKVTAATPPSPIETLESPGSDIPDGFLSHLTPMSAASDGGTGGDSASSSNSPTRRKRKRTRGRKEKYITTETVTEEARKVLDQYLKRSLSQNDASPLQREFQASDQMEVIDEDYVDGLPAGTGAGTSFKRSLESFDDATSHSPESVTRSLYSNSSHSSSFRHRIHIVRPLPDERQLEAALRKNKQKKNSRSRWKQRKASISSSSSSSSDAGDLEKYPQRKKSIFKRAKARLRQSFKRLKDKSPSDRYNGDNSVGKDAEKKKFSFKFGNTGSDKSSSAEISPTGQKDIASEIQHSNLCTSNELRPAKQNGSTVPQTLVNEAKINNKKKENKGIFDSLLKQIRKGGDKLLRKGSKDHQLATRSRSADAITLHTVRNTDSSDFVARNVSCGPGHVRKGSLGESEVYGVNTSLTGVGATCPDGFERLAGIQGRRVPRHHLKLDDLTPVRPSDLYQGAQVGYGRSDILPDGAGMLQHLEDVGEDLVDYGSPALARSNKSSESKPFHEKSEQEKEELYEKIAEQLALIADTYDLKSPHSVMAMKAVSTPQVTAPPPSRPKPPDKTEPEKKEPTAPAELKRPSSLRPHTAQNPGLEQSLGLLLRQHGDAAAQDMPDLTPVVRDLVRNASYSKFQQIVNEKIGDEPGWEQLALMFRLTQSAIQLAGMGTAVALQIKEHTLQYFEDRFAGWIIGQGGWESVVEESDLDGEVD